MQDVKLTAMGTQGMILQDMKLVAVNSTHGQLDTT